MSNEQYPAASLPQHVLVNLPKTGSLTLAAIITGTNGEAVIDREVYDTPLGRSFARAVLIYAGQVTGEDVSAHLSTLAESGRGSLPRPEGTAWTPFGHTLGRIRVDGGGNTVRFILEQLPGTLEEKLAGLVACCGGKSEWTATVTAPVGASALIIKQGHAEYRVTFGEDGPTIEAVPYPQPEGGQRWTDAEGQEYLIVAGGGSAIRLSSGTLLPLVDGAPEGAVRGVTFLLAVAA